MTPPEEPAGSGGSPPSLRCTRALRLGDHVTGPVEGTVIVLRDVGRGRQVVMVRTTEERLVTVAVHTDTGAPVAPDVDLAQAAALAAAIVRGTSPRLPVSTQLLLLAAGFLALCPEAGPGGGAGPTDGGRR